MTTFPRGTRVRINKDVMIIGGRLATVERARNTTERRFVAVKLVRRLRFLGHGGNTWLVDGKMLKEVK